MTYKKFLERLNQVPAIWRLKNGGEIRTVAKLHHSPLTAVLADIGGGELEVSAWQEAGIHLGLPSQAARMIHHASELTVDDGIVFNHNVRQALLEAIKILKIGRPADDNDE